MTALITLGSNQQLKNFYYFCKRYLKVLGAYHLSLTSERNGIFSMPFSWDTFAVSKDVMLFLDGFPHHVAISVWVLLEILTNDGVIYLVPLSLVTQAANSGPEAGLSLEWSVGFVRHSVGFPCSGDRLCLSAAMQWKRKPSLLWCLKAYIIFCPFFPKQQEITFNPGYHYLSYVLHPVLLSAHQLQGLLLI